MNKIRAAAVSVALIALLSACTWMARDVEEDLTEWGSPPGSVDVDAVVTGLPIVTVSTDGGKEIVSKEDYLDAVIDIKTGDSGVIVTGGAIKTLTDAADLPLTATQIRGRGNRTWRDYVKKPYRLKFLEKQKLFGLTKAKSWVLLANAADETLLKNILAFKMGQTLGLPFTNNGVPVELVVNGEYLGSYLLTEQVQVGKGRVDIDEDTGYLVEFDSYYDEEPKFKTSPVPFYVMIKSPETILSGFGDNFVKTSINGLIERLFDGGSVPDPAWRDLVDLDTFVEYVFIQEFLANPDFWHLNSVYMYKDGGADSRICAGPLWDFDSALSGAPDEARTITSTDTGEARLGEVLFRRIYRDPVFQEEYRALWNANKDTIAAFADDNGFVDEIAAVIAPSWELNHRLWNGAVPKSGRYKSIVDGVKDWWRERCAFMDREINK